ncbi:hypothetical protein NL108_016246 [Boleophthalmus pectinirostris]|nr:hypothetical protein NL108_016246 [Boleophthalmus pectinirostris]
MSVLRLLILVQILSLVQAQTVVQVHLGQSVVLNCSVKVDKTFWFMEVQGRHICISRSHGDKLKDFYVWTHFEKFSLEGNSLRIHNISEDDLTTYSCASMKDKQKSFGFQEVFEEKERYKLTTVASTPAPKESNITQPRPQQPRPRTRNNVKSTKFCSSASWV